MIKLELLTNSDSAIDVGFCGISRVVTANISSDEISVPIDWNGILWDIIQWFESSPKRVYGGYVCDLCPEESRSIYSSREEIWRIEVFEPFLAWVNNDLAEAETVSISGTPSSFTWARLC